MLITVVREPGKRHHNQHDHLVFILINSEAHGLTRIDPEYYTCECGATLTPEVLDEGDESKTSWPNCKSWRNGGREKCPRCDEYPSIGREQRFRARGVVPIPKDEIKRVTESQRDAALEKYDRECVVCGESAIYVKRIVPPRFGGNRELVNLAPLCEHHHDDFGHLHADLLQPSEWHLIRGLEWERVASKAKEWFEGTPADQIADHIESLQEEGQPDNPYPYVAN